MSPSSPLSRLVLILAYVSASLSSSRASAAAEASPYAALAALEARVADIGFRLTTANVGWCDAVQPQYGWIWGDRRQYDDARWQAARAAYRAAERDAPYIAAIAPGSPADVAGLSVGEPALAIDAFAVPDPEGDEFARIEAVERLFANNKATVVTLTTENDRTVQMTPVSGCASDFRVEARDRPSGAADGRLVLISAGLARFADDDAELAAAIAHELAHNILRHRARLDAAGVNRDLLVQVGRSAKLIRQTEVEADRLSVWLLAGAGYDPEAAVRFWKKFGKRTGLVLFQAGTHPRWRDRVKSVEGELLELRAAQKQGAPLHPPLIGALPPLE